jgi:hypothetical protein
VAALVQVPVAQAEVAEAAGVEPVLERGPAQVVQAAGLALVAVAGLAVLAAVGTEVVEEQERALEAVGPEPAAVVAPGQALVAAVQGAVGMEVVEEQERAAVAGGLEPGRELEVKAEKARRPENG